MALRLMTLEDVVETTRLSKATIYRRIADGTFPKPVRVGPRAVRFRSWEVESWIECLSPKEDAPCAGW